MSTSPPPRSNAPVFASADPAAPTMPRPHFDDKAERASPPQDEPFSPPTLQAGYHAESASTLHRSASGHTTSPDPNKHADYYDPYSTSALPANPSVADLPPGATHKPRESRRYEDLEYAEPPAEPYFAGPTGQQGDDQKKQSPLSRFLPGTGRYPIQQRIEAKRRGIGRQSRPYVVYLLTLAMVAVFVYELVLNSKEQGSPVSFKPVVNPMLGPSSSALINVGARFPPCMKVIEDLPVNSLVGCMNNTDNPVTRFCPLEDVCGFDGFKDDGRKPDQWFRFITPVFLHAGIIHILLNMLAQMTAAAQIEREMGSTGFLITYMAAGIFGNVLGGNFALVGAPSVGASGAIFGCIAVTWVDLLAHWSLIDRPVRRLVFQTIELLIGVALGYIPYVDNFAHLGGFLMGLLVGTTFYPVISQTRRHQVVVWVFRLAAIPVAIILFVTLIRNFYTTDPYAACSWCRYLSCFPLESNNHCKGTGYATTIGSSTGTSSV